MPILLTTAALPPLGPPSDILLTLPLGPASAPCIGDKMVNRPHDMTAGIILVVLPAQLGPESMLPDFE